MLGEYGADLELNTATRKAFAVVHKLRKHIAIQYSGVIFGFQNCFMKRVTLWLEATKHVILAGLYRRIVTIGVY